MRTKHGLWVLGLAMMVGCSCGSHDQAPIAEQVPATPEAPAGPLVTDPSFELRASAVGTYHAGQQGTFEIRLTPRGNYHVNQDYPTTVTLSGPGMTFPHAELAKADAAEFREQLARFDVPFTPSTAGEHQVTAHVDFAVCTPQQCMPDQRTLALSVPVQ